MKVVFISNYYNHHQKYLSQSLYNKTQGQYRFIATNVMGEERKKLGYESLSSSEYVLHTYLSEDEKKEAERWIKDADVVIIGSAPESLIEERKKAGKLILKYTEREFKQKQIHKYLYKWIVWHIRTPNKLNIHVLCASAYTAWDYAVCGMYRNKTYKWGYFPEFIEYENVERLIDSKKKNSILWVGRFLDWKHPDAAVRLAKRLKDEGFQFEINIIGTGIMESKLNELIKMQKVEDCVHMLGAMKTEQVREFMEKSQIFLFTSDRREGWGAVLNESMNSACAVVASHEIGSVPFMINDKQNGYIYVDGDEDSLYQKVKYLLEHTEEQKQLCKNAYLTVKNTWNAENAAERFLKLAEQIQEKGYCDLFEDGPCSKAEIIKDNWFRNK